MNHHRRVVKRNKRNWIYTLKPKGTKSGYSGSNYIIENGHKIFGLKVAPKTSIIIHGIELGKPNTLPYMGRNSACRQEAASKIAHMGYSFHSE
jgi:hypothetical protein